jgi:hypothetical protein
MASGPGRKFALAFTPTLLAGAILTAALTPPRRATCWLEPGCCSTARASPPRALSVPVVPVMGVSFMVAGVVALLLPAGAANWMMLAGFGALHIAFGFFIARRYGG